MLTFIILSSASFSSSSSPTPIFFFFSGDLGRLRLELSSTICALSAFHCFTPGQNTKNDYHCSDTSFPGLACTFEWLLLSSTHCFFISAHVISTPWCFNLSQAFLLRLLHWIKLSSNNHRQYGNICVSVAGCWTLLTLQGGSVNVLMRPGAFVLTSHLQAAQMDKKKSAEHGVFTQLRWQTPVPPLPPLPSAIFVSILVHVNCK